MAVGPNGETLDQLALKRYPDTKAIDHVHTGGNSSGIVDGAAVVLMGSEEWGKKAGLKPRAKIRAMATVGRRAGDHADGAGSGVEEGARSAPACRSRTSTCGRSTRRSRPCRCRPRARSASTWIEINVNGGAIALGHPLGATGAILLGTALDELERVEQVDRADHAVHRRRHGHRDDHRARLVICVYVPSVLWRCVALALVACEAPREPAPPAGPHWVARPAPSAWPLGAVHGRIGRGQAPQPVRCARAWRATPTRDASRSWQVRHGDGRGYGIDRRARSLDGRADRRRCGARCCGATTRATARSSA